MQIAMIDDQILPFDKVEHTYFDRGLYFGDGVYEVIRSYNGNIFALDEHLQRFSNSLAAIKITGIDINQIRSKVLKAFETAAIPNAKIYFHITRGSGPRNHNITADLRPNFFLTLTELEDASKTKANGISVSTYPDLRWKRCDIKSLNLLPNVLANSDAAKKGCEEAILVDEQGFITEGSHSAFLAIFGNKLQTAPLTPNILPSITRNFVIKAAQNIGMKIMEKSISVKGVQKADELIMAVTTKDIVGIVKFDGKPVGNGQVGPQTKKLMQEFAAFTK